MRGVLELLEFAAWFSSRPPLVRDAIRIAPPWSCYRQAGREGRLAGHYIIEKYEEHEDGSVTVSVIHGADSFLAGHGVFGLNPATLKPCGCGEWQWPEPIRENLTNGPTALAIADFFLTGGDPG